ncbi:cyd operon YbgE family protein [Marilutibacter alkalisoli]|uniref:Cyd operon protein YbgE n=1 Tax=Marilutibacter alkalisoli TaxID=2591633 RepID=A0A514BP86_9GAMM|nr:cyd operon YbgE family protein [Lysobacter alkalisoli]QDH69196.1 Cyd operon protein YbgE [Lysobacter alkalisoli]
MARIVSLLLALTLSAALLILPAMRARELTSAGHGLLMPLLILVCALFVHGLGLRPQRRWAQAMLSPWLLWPASLVLAATWWWLS